MSLRETVSVGAADTETAMLKVRAKPNLNDTGTDVIQTICN